MCKGWHVVPNGLAPNWCRTIYLPVLYDLDTSCGSPPPVQQVLAKCSGQLGGEGGLLKGEVRCIDQDLIPYVGQLEFTNVPIKGWIIDPDTHGLLDGPCGVVHLPTQYGKAVHTGVMT